MSIAHAKAKSVGKDTKSRGPELEKRVLGTMKVISDMVGGTLGPGGMPVLIERQEDDFPPIVTKDGVTVFRNLGFDNSTSQVILEAARDAAIRTANEAGDGTSSATILAEAFVRLTSQYCSANRRVSPQRVTRRLAELFRDKVEPAIRSWSIPANLGTETGKGLLHSVAKISANGDVALADAVMGCYDLVGDSGNITIAEISGSTNTYDVERIEGFPITNMGYEDTCGKFANHFINDPGNQRIYLEKPMFVVYHGKITEIQTIQPLMEKIGTAWQDPSQSIRNNVVLVATGFSSDVLAQLAMNFVEMTSINVVPFLCPISPIGGQLPLLEDLCAVTGSKLFDPATAPLDQAEPDDLGLFARMFEMGRFRATILTEDGVVGNDGVMGDPPNMFPVLARVDLLEQIKLQAGGELEKSFLEERIGKLTGGIAKLRVVGSSSGDMRERRDRAEDAICAIRGAIKHGCLPGGGWTLLKLIDLLKGENDPVADLLASVLVSPVVKLYQNVGMEDDEIKSVIEKLSLSISKSEEPLTYDCLEQKFVQAVKTGILDSTPAVLEAIRNSISIGKLLGTLGGTIVFARDSDFDKADAKESRSWLRDVEEGKSYVDERGM
jgi:chaperonin GroEL